ncbi:hypothetical protein [Saccharothrix sp. HUAS TT1]|uniref:hypothetical protein n=1 Tax=Saccharothrix sp. HUAS TT1 TaxID=3231910 RepID=UPI00345C5D6C
MKVISAIAALIGPLLLLGGGAANADPYWEPVSKNSSFRCSYVVPHSFYDVTFQTCVVVNGNSTQAVAIVANHSPTTLSLEAPNVALYVNGPISYDRNCLTSVLTGGYTRACFGPTQTRPCSATVRAWSQVVVQGYVMSAWSPDRQMCT